MILIINTKEDIINISVSLVWIIAKPAKIISIAKNVPKAIISKMILVVASVVLNILHKLVSNV